MATKNLTDLQLAVLNALATMGGTPTVGALARYMGLKPSVVRARLYRIYDQAPDRFVRCGEYGTGTGIQWEITPTGLEVLS